MYDNVFSAFNCFKSFFDQFRPRLYQYLNRYIIGNMIPFDQSAQDLIFGFRCRRKTNFYFFKANIYQSLEHQQLFFQLHRRNQSLIPVAQVNTAPNRRLGNSFIRPLAIRPLERLKRNILFTCLFHKYLPPICLCRRSGPTSEAEIKNPRSLR